MAARSRFIDDRPRIFPTETKRLAPAKVPIPKPVLSGVSMIVDKNQPNKPPVKKSFTKWKQQHDALFERKHIETKNRTAAFVDQRNGIIVARDSSPDAAKFELDFKKTGPSTDHYKDHHEHFELDCNNRFVDSIPAANQKRFQLQSMMAFSQLNRKMRSEASGFTVPPAGQHDTNATEESQPNLCNCRSVASSPVQVTDSEARPQSRLQIVDSSMEKSVQPKRQPASKLLADIVEEQIEIVEQQKQILKQQNEIFRLQYQIEKLLLMNGTGQKSALPHKPLQSIAASPSVESNALPIENGAAIENCSDHSPNGRKSIGVMTSCHLNEICSPVAMMGNGSPKDTMLERINKIIENSPPMINYKQTNGNGCRISPHRTDINISSQTLIYKASTRNNISVNEPKLADRSFALHLLDMKYHPETPPMTPKRGNRVMNPRQNAMAKAKSSPSKLADNDFVPSDISPDKYDYLMRHGLLKK